MVLPSEPATALATPAPAAPVITAYWRACRAAGSCGAGSVWDLAEGPSHQGAAQTGPGRALGALWVPRCTGLII